MTFNASRKLRLAGLLLLAASLSACGVMDRVGKRMDDTWAGDMLFSDRDKVTLTVDGGNDLNPGPDGKPLSVVVRVYQLNSLERFLSADADALWDQPKVALGNTLLDARELTLLPGMGQVEQWPMALEARYIGVAAFFRETRQTRWKVAVAADSMRKESVLFSSGDGARIYLDGSRVAVARGTDVLDDPAARQLAAGAPVEQQGATAQLLQKAGDSALRAAGESVENGARDALESKVNSALEGSL
ncbi:type VI secretion system lipoprotein TssJ [Pseudomonas sp. JH-2]|uniref:type VI secretion system lipoprotein TssJ n=1 Tax=Pseudomonas sp. JH-2 TaxID=3114998 RepID=UPI002E25FF70|nr:type VI secretion system lipoprotein TssJ [Pseudomonas sp. JH-2]